MQKLLMVFAVLSVAAIATPSAQAVPAAATPQAGNGDSQTVLVADGCGRHFHRGRHGRCRHN
jgi:Flp pilus assembly protein CpaB